MRTPSAPDMPHRVHSPPSPGGSVATHANYYSLSLLGPEGFGSVGNQYFDAE
jgi:hypothetical protein